MKALFVADDGQEFETQEECLAYETVLTQKAEVIAWADAAFPARGSNTRAVNIVMSWLQYKQSGEVEVEAEPAYEDAA
jgi:hypothetical protein